MAGAYFVFWPNACQVGTYAVPPVGGAGYNPNVNPGHTYSVAQWNQMFPTYFIIAPWCSGWVPKGTSPTQPPAPPPTFPPPAPTIPPPPPPAPPPPTLPYIPVGPPPQEHAPPPPEDPVTGPPEDPCAPAMSKRADGDRLIDTGQHLLYPGGGMFSGGRVGADHIGAASEPHFTGKPAYVRQPILREKDGLIVNYEPGTADGWNAFHSPDINEFGLRGDGVHPKGRWARRISSQDLIMHSGVRRDPAAGDNADQGLGWGIPSARSRHPMRGFTTKLSGAASDRVLDLYPTSFHGAAAADVARTFRVHSALAVVGPVWMGSFTTAELAAITSPQAGMIVWNEDEEEFQYYDGSAWVPLAAGEGVFANVAYQSITADQTDYDLLAVAVSGQYYLDPDADGWVVNSIVNPGAAVTRMVRITNVSEDYSIVFANEGAGDAENRFITGLGIDYTLPPLGTLTMVYDVSAQRWRIDA